jgi:hemolysin-activating ACP:hemolysin acyltransferase
VSDEEKRKIASASKHLTAQFGEIVTVLMRSPLYKHYSLADMQWLVLPPLLTGQYALATAQHKDNGMTAPVGLVLWARVSDDVDKRLQTLKQPIKLAPHEWQSGDNVWVVAAIGEERILKSILGRLHENEWKKSTAKMQGRGADGKAAVIKIEGKPGAKAPEAATA